MSFVHYAKKVVYCLLYFVVGLIGYMIGFTEGVFNYFKES